MKGSRNPEAAFLAIMTASATHEVRNVLAIIKESAGLVEDMVHLFERKGALDREKLHRTVERIDAQVRRGADLLTSLNRLSHTLDSDLTQIELGEELKEVVFLTQRLARKRGNRVELSPPDRTFSLSLNQLHLHMVLYAAVDLLLGGLEDGGVVTLLVEEEEEGPVVEVRGEQAGGPPSPGPLPEEELAGVLVWVRALGGELRRVEGAMGLRILFPQTTGAESSVHENGV